MPAPQASMMKQLARLKFSSNGLRVPNNWKEPAGDPAAAHYSRAFKPAEKITTPATTVPPLFIAASMNKYHTDTQKKLTADFGGYIDGVCDTICNVWSQWQAMAKMTGVIINGPAASGGAVVGPPWTKTLMDMLPQSTPMMAAYSKVIATVLGTGWLTYTSTIHIAKPLPWYPAFVMVTLPVAPPAPNVPCPVIMLDQVTAALAPSTMKNQMCTQLGMQRAPYHPELFDAICDAFDKCFKIWQASTMVTNVMGTGPVPTFAPPYVPGGPVVAGVGTHMTPGGFT